MDAVTITLAQMVVEDGRPDRNLHRMRGVARDYGASSDIILFPEASVTGFNPPDATQAMAEPLDGETVKVLSEIASEFHTTIVGGLLERDGDRIYNTSVWVGPDGLRLWYRKMHRWQDEARRIAAGDAVRARNWGGTRFGLLICYDVEFPETARATAALGLDVLLLTNGNMAPYGPVHRRAIQARAQENQVYVVMANRVGVAGRERYVGESMAANPYGEIMAALGEDEGAVTVTLDLGLIAESRSRYRYLDERRIHLQGPDQHSDGDIVSWQVGVPDPRSTSIRQKT